MRLPSNPLDLVECAKDIVDVCHGSKSSRVALYQNLSRWMENGRGDGSKSLCNTLYHHIDRLASHLFSPAELRFSIDFETMYDQKILAQGEVASRLLSRMWEQKNIDQTYACGVAVSLLYGAGCLKQMWTGKGITANLLMPWQFGVYREDLTGVRDQEAICETSLLTIHEVRRVLSQFGDPAQERKLFEKIKAHATSGAPSDVGPTNYFHQILSSATLNTSGSPEPPRPGGIVDLSTPIHILAPEVQIPLVKFHEMYVIDEEIDDYCTIQIIEPDVLISPRFKRKNRCAPKTLPYTLIQPNQTPGYFWGRSELLDLLEPQGLMSDLLSDTRRLMGMQFDKLLAFTGDEGMTDERYAQFRGSGYIGLAPGAGVTDLTPKLPEATFQYINLISKLMEQISGFDNILSGQGESGVRAGVHADTLVRTASPRLRDRSLLVERQCADAADVSLELLETYDSTVYHSNDPKAPVEFVLKQLPEDRRVSVDSHSASPIYEQDHKDLIGFGVKHGFIDGESAIDLLPLPMKDKLKMRYREAQEAKAKMIQEHPELLPKPKAPKA